MSVRINFTGTPEHIVREFLAAPWTLPNLVEVEFFDRTYFRVCQTSIRNPNLSELLEWLVDGERMFLLIQVPPEPSNAYLFQIGSSRGIVLVQYPVNAPVTRALYQFLTENDFYVYASPVRTLQKLFGKFPASKSHFFSIVDEILTPSGLPTSFAKLVDCISQKPVVSLLGSNQKPGRADECPLSTLGVLRWSLHVIIVMELVSEFQPVKRQKQVKPKPKPVQPKPAPPKQVQQKPVQPKPVQQKPVKPKPMPCPSSSSESSDSDQITWL